MIKNCDSRIATGADSLSSSLGNAMNLPIIFMPLSPNNIDSLSSSLQESSSSSVSLENHFEISNVDSLEFSNFCRPCTALTTCHSSHFFRMEVECDKSDATMKVDPDPPDPLSTTQDDIMKLLMAISTKMMANMQDLQNQIRLHTQDLQDQLLRNDFKLNAEIQRITNEHENFKQEIRAELISMRNHYHSTSLPPVNNTTINASSSIGDSNLSLTSGPTLTSAVSIPTMSAVNNLPNVSTTPVSNDVFQTQMLQMLNETFSKLSTALQDLRTTAKSEWPKISGEVPKFKNWYLAIMAQLSLPPWTPLYDSVKNDIVSTISDTQLNGKLYAKLLACLEGQAMKNMISWKHLHANGLILLQELHHMYKPKNVPEVLAAKTAEFWSKMKRSNYETVDDDYNHFHELLDEVNDFRETVTKKDAIRHFIFTLVSDFESIQNSYRIDNLPADWKTDDWPTLLILCRDHHNSLHPNGPPSKKDNHSGDNAFASKQDCLDHQKKVRLWFLNPVKFKNELDAAQCKYSGKCLYHLCDTHSTPNCNIKCEFDKLLSNKKSSSSPTPPLGQLRHITEDCHEDAVDNDDWDIVTDDVCNDTNDASLQYFA